MAGVVAVGLAGAVALAGAGVMGLAGVVGLLAGVSALVESDRSCFRGKGVAL